MEELGHQKNSTGDQKDVKYIQTEDKIKADDFVVAGDLLFTRLNGSIDYVGNCAKVPMSFPDNISAVNSFLKK